MTGTIKKLVEGKFFGFITSPELGKDLFFHKNSFVGDYDSLAEGDEVSFESEDSPKGLNAVNVTLVK